MGNFIDCASSMCNLEPQSGLTGKKKIDKRAKDLRRVHVAAFNLLNFTPPSKA
jgi:hypothetical protein